MIGWKRILTTGFCWLVALTVSLGHPFAAAWGQAAPARAAFDQPRMPLDQALRRFGQTAGFDVVFKEDLVRGRQAAAVSRARSAHDALAQILTDTGLAARFTRPNAIILEPVGAEAAHSDLSLDPLEIVSPLLAGPADYKWYGDKLLEACLATLRQSAALKDRPFKLTVYLWVNDSGTVTDLRAYGAGDQIEIAKVANGILKGLTIDGLPPANMPQPVGLRIDAR